MHSGLILDSLAIDSLKYPIHQKHYLRKAKQTRKVKCLIKYKYKHKYENSVIKVGNNIIDYISTEIASNCELIFSY